jgi:hypothetical protein
MFDASPVAEHSLAGLTRHVRDKRRADSTYRKAKWCSRAPSPRRLAADLAGALELAFLSERTDGLRNRFEPLARNRLATHVR